MNLFVTVLVVISLIGLTLWGVLNKTSSSFLWRKLISLHLLVLIGVLIGLLPINSAQVDPNDNSVDILFVVDTTYSMNAKDGRDGTLRIDDAKKDIAAFAQSATGSRYAITSFNDRLSIQLPFTSNLSDLDIALQSLSPGSQFNSRLPMNLSESLTQADAYLRAVRDQDTSRQRVLVLLTDGEITGGVDTIEKISEAAGTLSEVVDQALVIGYGTESGSTLANFETNFETGRLEESEFELFAEYDGEYQEVISKKNPANLSAIAAELNAAVADSNNASENASQLVNLQRSAIKDAASTPEQLALRQNILHVPYALLAIVWLFSFEILKLRQVRRPVATLFQSRRSEK